MKSKLKFIVPIALVALFGVYKFVLAKPAPVGAKPKIHGTVYVLPKEFLINLKDGHYAKLSVALVFKEGYTGVPAGGHGEGSASTTKVEGYGSLPQEAVVRAIVTDTLTDQTADRLTSEAGRTRLQKKILKRIGGETDVKAEEILFTDLAVQ
jgi:flagellar FliL protein